MDSRGKRALSTRQAVKVVPARGGVEQQSVRLCERREGQRSRVGERLREWRLLHGHEHLDVGGMCRGRKGQTEEAADEETPSQAGDGTATATAGLPVVVLVKRHHVRPGTIHDLPIRDDPDEHVEGELDQQTRDE